MFPPLPFFLQWLLPLRITKASERTTLVFFPFVERGRCGRDRGHPLATIPPFFLFLLPSVRFCQRLVAEDGSSSSPPPPRLFFSNMSTAADRCARKLSGCATVPLFFPSLREVLAQHHCVRRTPAHLSFFFFSLPEAQIVLVGRDESRRQALLVPSFSFTMAGRDQRSEAVPHFLSGAPIH